MNQNISKVGGLKLLGVIFWLLAIGGLAYGFQMNTAVETGMGNMQVNNLGLMSERLIIFILSIGFSINGTLFYCFSLIPSSNSAQPEMDAEQLRQIKSKQKLDRILNSKMKKTDHLIERMNKSLEFGTLKQIKALALEIDKDLESYPPDIFPEKYKSTQTQIEQILSREE